jgi:hypothetical protein
MEALMSFFACLFVVLNREKLHNNGLISGHEGDSLLQLFFLEICSMWKKEFCASEMVF